LENGSSQNHHRRRHVHSSLGERAVSEDLHGLQGIAALHQKIIHARWSGEACWIPLGDFDLGVIPENPTSRPLPGQLLFYPADISETEILLPYGAARFCSVAGELAGNRILTITENLEQLAQLGKDILWNGSREIRFEVA
jgi:hypothetical protein